MTVFSIRVCCVPFLWFTERVWQPNRSTLDFLSLPVIFQYIIFNVYLMLHKTEPCLIYPSVTLDYKALLLLLNKPDDENFQLGGKGFEVEFCAFCDAIRVNTYYIACYFPTVLNYFDILISY